jgi:hypothetical protein
LRSWKTTLGCTEKEEKQVSKEGPGGACKKNRSLKTNKKRHGHLLMSFMPGTIGISPRKLNRGWESISGQS